MDSHSNKIERTLDKKQKKLLRCLLRQGNPEPVNTYVLNLC